MASSALMALTATAVGATPASAGPVETVAAGVVRAAVPPGSIQHVMVIDIENESFAATFGPGSVATYLNQQLLPQGELLSNYYATGHVSNDNYVSQVSGQAPNPVNSSDCITNLSSLAGTYNDVTPGTLDPNQAQYPGQVDGQGCVFPSSVQTIGSQLDAAMPGTSLTWRSYAEDMGNSPARDGGTPDPLGGTDCAHPTQVNGTAADGTNNAQGPNATGGQVQSPVADQYVDRHNPFIYFHSVTDNAAYCAAHVVPLGTVTVGTGGQPDTFHGHLAADLASAATTPAFGFITPNVCNDGHDAKCAGTNTNGSSVGGLTGVDAWLQHWMPLLLASPAYRNGSMLIVLTADEGAISDSTAVNNEQPGPSDPNPGFSPLLGTEPPPGTDPGGGRTGALLLNSKWIIPGTVNATPYNHYSALRSYEDLLGITSGGSDGLGHLGFAGAPGLAPFGPDVFNAPSGQGYREVAADGGIFTYGEAGYYGSTGNIPLNKPIVGIAAATAT